MNETPQDSSRTDLKIAGKDKSAAQFLEWCGYALEFVAERDGFLPSFPGSAIRGAFGRALKHLACVMRNRPCEGCPLELTCLYTTIFETRPNSLHGLSNGFRHPPHPLVLKVDFLEDRTVEKGATIRVGVNLFGTAVSAAPVVLRALEIAAERGLGSNRIPFRLEKASQTGGHAEWSRGQPFLPPKILGAPELSGSIARWKILTPVRLRSDGRPVDHRNLHPRDLAMPVYRRLDLLARFFGNSERFPEFPNMKDRAESLCFSNCCFSWKQLTRYSSRQSKTHSVSGMVGTVEIDCTHAPEWGEVLAWGPVVHIGKGTSMGLGRVEAAQ